ncbi:hypothetical protein DB88DRAFT_141842 [Papiliotrema laurentii]|nr:hypothetical protein DB88DRAFT_141842 [Papiliotrema laurentii]
MSLVISHGSGKIAILVLAPSYTTGLPRSRLTATSLQEKQNVHGLITTALIIDVLSLPVTYDGRLSKNMYVVEVLGLSIGSFPFRFRRSTCYTNEHRSTAHRPTSQETETTFYSAVNLFLLATCTSAAFTFAFASATLGTMLSAHLPLLALAQPVHLQSEHLQSTFPGPHLVQPVEQLHSLV